MSRELAKLDLPDLHACVWGLLGQVPGGRVTTFGRLAAALGSPAAARWIGHLMLHHQHKTGCPCHRLVRADGEIGGHVSGNPDSKARLLEEEGVAVQNGRVDLGRCQFDQFSTENEKPLEALRRFQLSLLGRLVLEPPEKPPQLVAGLDVSYSSGDRATAAYALVDLTDPDEPAGRLVWSHTLCQRITFPYISSYLAFRELPVLLALVEEVRQIHPLADVLLVDGSGILHPRRSGIATMLGILLDWPTIGVTKKLLCGSVNLVAQKAGESRPVWHDEERIGTAILPASGTARPIFVSPGHRTDVEFCRRLVTQTLGRRRLPEPIHWADRLSRQAAQKP